MNDYFMNTYHRLPAVFTEGKGCRLTDVDGKRYLDFTAGIAVNCLGHGHPALVQAIAEQAAKLVHVSNYFLSDTALAFAEELVAACSKVGMRNVFLGNSGAEANEGAVKIARKYSLAKYGPGRHRIATLKGSFHGRTITTLAATGQDRFHQDFGPFTEGFIYIPSGDIAALEKALDGTVCGLLMEPVQGESGIRPLDPAYAKAAAKLCAERDVLLMYDEIQSGVGRTGDFLGCEIFTDGKDGFKPDVVTIAKGLAGGIPVGAVLAGDKAKDVLGVSDHGSTFGGNPLAAAAGRAVLSIVNQPAFLAEIARKGEKLRAALAGWKHPLVAEIRGRGLMLGVDIGTDAWPVLEACLSKGLMMLSAGPRTLRFLPPYVITDAEIDEGLSILKSVLDSVKK
ncbi:MAG TPA: aspartate aminotransferase family protein [Treponema sp.]|nr:aspartate aminotransferase family protein [Treponema sp.]